MIKTDRLLSRKRCALRCNPSSSLVTKVAGLVGVPCCGRTQASTTLKLDDSLVQLGRKNATTAWIGERSKGQRCWRSCSTHDEHIVCPQGTMHRSTSFV